MLAVGVITRFMFNVHTQTKMVNDVQKGARIETTRIYFQLQRIEWHIWCLHRHDL